MSRPGLWLVLGAAFAAGQVWGCVGNEPMDSSEATSSSAYTFTCPNDHYVGPGSAYVATDSSVDWVQEGAVLTLDPDTNGVVVAYVDEAGNAWSAHWRL